MLNRKSSSKSTKAGIGGIKMLIAVSSIAITLGGWGILAHDQLQSGLTTQTAFAQSSVTNTQQGLNQSAASQVSSAVRPVVRTRSSR